MTQTEVLKLALEALTPWASEDANHTEQYAAYHALRKALAQPDPVPYWHSEFLKHNTTSDHCMMENAQGDLERIKLVQTGVGIGKPEQEPVACPDGKPCKHGAWCTETYCQEHCEFRVPLQRKPLSMQERTSIVRANKSFHDKDEIDPYGIIDDVEAAHGIKE